MVFGRSKSDDNESERSSLFSRKKKDKTDQNPYANMPPTSYAQAKASAGIPPTGHGFASPPPAGKAAPGGMSDNKYGAPPPANGGGYGASSYGAPNGYGQSKYGAPPPPQDNGAESRYGPSGYGGFGNTSSSDTTATDSNRDALFGGARERAQQQSQPPPYEEGNGYGAPNSGAYGGSTNSSYGAYADRQLTAEEEEEEDIQATKQEIKFMKQQDVSSTRNALRIAAQAEETGRNTLARLGAQGEMIHNTEKNLDLAANHNRQAEDKARELKTLNKSMFAVHVSNPFTAKERRRQRDEDIINKHRDERIERETTRQAAFQSTQRMEKTFKDLNNGGGPGAKGSNVAERAKYQFEADSDDDAMENEIDSNLDALSGAAGRLNALARATGKEVEEQNRHLDRITGKSDMVDDQIAMNRARLDRFH
ncbi:MAG: Protein transport protein S9 plasma membrane t-SNARE [Cirrosporium novae-zelandiae]|nr:MAG: Protein transport protein S9 plasma membrane t-SNARE [Cirrosporium novae-zelandiae]